MELNADFRSDTLTRPTLAMLDAMHAAETGDDVFAEDPTTEAFQQRCAELFGHEAALFCPSGTMTNQIINVHVRPGDEVICDRMAHIYNYEGGGIARNSGASLRLLHGDHGRFTGKTLQRKSTRLTAITPAPRLCIEDTCNRGGGAVWNEGRLAIRRRLRCGGCPYTSTEHGVGMPWWHVQEIHCQLADWKAYGQLFDSISVCFSKGLGVPGLGIGSKAFIAEAHRSRKVFGGGMRQIGVLTAACNHALDHELPGFKRTTSGPSKSAMCSQD